MFAKEVHWQALKSGAVHTETGQPVSLRESGRGTRERAKTLVAERQVPYLVWQTMTVRPVAVQRPF